MDIIRLDKPLSYWLDNQNNNIAYVLYKSFTTWDKTLLAKIQLREEALDVYCGDSEENRKRISSFQTEAFSPKPIRYLHIGNNGNQIKKHVYEIVANIGNNNPQEFNVKQLFLHIVSDNYQYSYTNVEALKTEEIETLIEQHTLIDFKSGDLKKSFYCGITNDVDIRMEQHRTSDFSIVDERVGAYVCANVEVAKQVEGLLGDAGYDIGGPNAAGNGAAETSRVVYFLKKGSL